MKSPSNILIIPFLLFTACTEELVIDTSKSTADDPISDITFLNYFFYTTNFDESGNAGPQIDLFQFYFNQPVNRFELSLNGQGYLAAANDGSNLYFQPRFTDFVLKVSPIGELFWYRVDEMEENVSSLLWKGSGLVWKDTSLITFYQNSADSTLYRARYLSVENNLKVVRDTTIFWDHLNKEGVLAMERRLGGNGFIFLAKDRESRTILFWTDLQFIPITGVEGFEYYVLEDEAVGLARAPWELEPPIYISFSDRRIEPLYIY